MSILDDIIASKRSEVEIKKQEVSIDELRNRELFAREIHSLKQSLLDESRTGIIAEFKRQSPSKGVINDGADVREVTEAYMKGGAAGLSILTDEKFFGGHETDLLRARIHEVPILRKDFMIDPFQLVESRAMGADVILLIAACLTPREVKELATYAKKLELEVLLELHDESELNHICEEVDIVGINNRDLKTFEVDIERSLKMAAKIPDEKIKIAESGINSVEDILLFRKHGFKGFLIGECFMREKNPGQAFRMFVEELKSQIV
jgi:indole-3-glycerol phosphate synthase